MAMCPTPANWGIISNAQRLKYLNISNRSKRELEVLLDELRPDQRAYLEKYYIQIITER